MILTVFLRLLLVSFVTILTVGKSFAQDELKEYVEIESLINAGEFMVKPDVHWEGKARRKNGSAGPISEERLIIHKDLVFATVGENEETPLMINLYLQPTKEKQPLIIFIRGGGWTGGSHNSGLTRALRMAMTGFAVATIGYRDSDQGKFPVQIHDCKGGIRWLRAHAKEYGLDPDRFGVWGPSAGGYLAALIGTSGKVKELEGDIGGNLEYSSQVQAVCDWHGPTDFLQMTPYNPSLPPEGHNAPKSPESRLVGGPIQENPYRSIAIKANPINYIDKDDPPFLIMHGDKDGAVPIEQSELLFKVLSDKGVPVSFGICPGADHGRYDSPKTYGIVARFFEETLKGKN